MTTRSAYLGGANLTVAGTGTLFTVPAGETWILKTLGIAFYTFETGSLSLFHQVAGGAELHSQDVLAGDGIQPFDVSYNAWWEVFGPGDAYTWDFGGENPCDIICSGAKLIGVAT